MKEGAKIANKQDSDFIIFEGSGAAIPPIKTDKTIVLVGTNQDILNITNFFGPYRIGLGDLIILTMCEEPMTSKEKVNKIIFFFLSYWYSCFFINCYINIFIHYPNIFFCVNYF